MKIQLSTTAKIAIGLILLGVIGFLFESKSATGLGVGLGGLVLVYLGFRLFWKHLERKFED